MQNPWESTTIPIPFLLNPLKHHRDFIRAFTDHYSDGWPKNKDEVLQQMQMTGRLMMDIYTGHMAVAYILGELRQQLSSLRVLDSVAYEAWIAAADKKFRILRISDSSRWTMLHAVDSRRYIHVHPARSSPWSTRIKALPLKTAILLKLEGKGPGEHPVVEAINAIRETYLDEAPIRDGRDTKNTVRIFEVLFSQI
jgi:hypothetical protein